MAKMSYYNACKILGIPEDCTVAEVKSTYRKLAKQYHPDINPSGEEMMKQIVSAYEVVIEYVSNNTTNTKYRSSHSWDNFGRETEAQKQKSQQEHFKNMEQKYNKHPRLNDWDELHLMKSWLIGSGRARDIYDIWVTNDFRVYLLQDMATSHIANCIKYIERFCEPEEYSPRYERLQKLLKERLPKISEEQKIDSDGKIKTTITLHF